MFTQRMTRLPWLVGVVLLVVSLVGASQVYQNARTVKAGPQDDEAKSRYSVGQGVYQIGRVDVESGLVHLAPMQPGAIAEIHCFEGAIVKKGDLLLRVQDDAYKAMLAKAEAGVSIAETQLAQAKQGLERFPEIVAQQEAAVSAAKAKLEAAKFNFARIERLLKLQIQQVNQDEVDAARKGIEALNAAVVAEEARLREIQLSKPDEKVNEAQKNVELRKTDVTLAREALDRCTLRSPQDGTILRILATIGTQFGPQSQMAALDFAPNGPRILRVEVPQEFASRVTVGASATIQDEANVGPTWHGKVLRIGDAYLTKRPTGGAPDFTSGGTENRMLEVIVSIEPASTMPKIGQLMRASIAGTTR